MTPFTLLAFGLEKALNQYLHLDPDMAPKLAELDGKAIAVELAVTPLGWSGPVLTLYFLPTGTAVRVTDQFAGAPDVVVRATPLALAGQLRRGNQSFDAGVEIQGDVHIGKAFQDLLSRVDIDWEEQLSRVVGDTAAHQIGNLARGLRTWGRRSLDTLLKNTAEYFQEEARDLPSSGAMADFLDAVDTLRSDTDRLEARIRRLQQSLPASEPAAPP